MVALHFNASLYPPEFVPGSLVGDEDDGYAVLRDHLVDHTEEIAGALDWARTFCGMARPVGETDPGTGARAAQRIAHARQIWATAVPVRGTPAERYLAQTCGLVGPAPDDWSDAVRYHPDRRALVLAATDAGGAMQGVRLLFLGQDARQEERGHLTKQSVGMLAGTTARIPGNGTALLLAAGLETGLAVAAATGRNSWIALGKIDTIKPLPGRPLIVCIDDDPKNSPAARSVVRAVADWRSVGLDVALATPWQVRRFDRSGFHDVARADGPDAVWARIDEALAPPGPPPGMGAVPIDVARRQVGDAVGGFFVRVPFADARKDQDADKEPPAPMVHAIKVGVGIGKSEAALQQIAWWLVHARARGDRRSIVIAIPRHVLADELVGRFLALPEAKGLTARGWRGREAADPDAGGLFMCRDLEAVQDVQKAFGDVAAQVCGNAVDEPRCPFFSTCGYQEQNRATADLWFVPHQLLFTKKPAAIGEVAAIVVDEAIWQKGLEGVGDSPQDISVETLRQPVGLNFRLETDRLQSIQNRLRPILDDLPDGPLSRTALLAAGFTADMAQEGARLSRLRLHQPEVGPGMPAAARKAATAAVAAGNQTAVRLAQVFAAIRCLLAPDGPKASGWVALVTVPTQNGPQRVLRLRGRQKVREGWQVPTLIMDGLLDPDLLRPCWPQIEVTAQIEAATPHARFRQLIDRDWPKSALVPDENQSEDENDRRLKNSYELRATIWREARKVQGRVLVITYQAVEKQWRRWGMPDHVEIAHHNAIAGQDGWKDVALLVVIGRTEPGPPTVERITEALTGAAMMTSATRFDRMAAAVHDSDGQRVGVERSVHPNPMAEAVRWQLAEGGLIQGIGRARAVNRSAADPVEILILCNRPLPLVIDSTVTARDCTPSMDDLMLAHDGVALANLTDVSQAYPGLWLTREAAKKSAQREPRLGTFPLRELLYGECPQPLRGAAYQLAGPGKRPARLLFDPAVVPADDLRAWLEKQLGPLARLEIDQPSAGLTA